MKDFFQMYLGTVGETIILIGYTAIGIFSLLALRRSQKGRTALLFIYLSLQVAYHLFATMNIIGLKFPVIKAAVTLLLGIVVLYVFIFFPKIIQSLYRPDEHHKSPDQEQQRQHFVDRFTETLNEIENIRRNRNPPT